MADDIGKELLRDAENRMKGTVAAMEDDFGSIRTGRASTAILDRIVVEYYGVPTPLIQLAGLAAPEPQMITIRPFDQGTIKAIEKAILASDLGLTPNNDGKLIRLSIPPLNEERRRELAKIVSKRIEEARVSLRNVRRDTRDDLRDAEKEKMISEDDLKRFEERLQDLTNHYTEIVENMGTAKEKEVMEV